MIVTKMAVTSSPSWRKAASLCEGRTSALTSNSSQHPGSSISRRRLISACRAVASREGGTTRQRDDQTTPTNGRGPDYTGDLSAFEIINELPKLKEAERQAI